MKTLVCTQFDEELSHWLDNAWDKNDLSVPERLATHAKGCASCRRRLSVVLRLLGTKRQTPEGLSDAIIRRVENAERPRHRNRMPILVAAASLIITLGMGVFIGVNSIRTVPIELTFYAPDASTVSVVGSWNGWDPNRDPMLDSNGDGVWHIKLRLTSGNEHLYQFVIDEKTRIADPSSIIQLDDGYGGTNSVMSL